jgi:hypothetical protein
MQKIRGYLATHFFDIFGFEGTAKLAQEIREACPFLELYVPQENGEINDKESNDGNITAEAIYQADTDYLLSSQVLIAYLDGVEVDAGVAGEVGIMAGSLETLQKLGIQHTPKLIVGIYSDMRRLGTGDNHMYKNLFVIGAVEKWGVVVMNKHDAIDAIQVFFKDYPM